MLVVAVAVVVVGGSIMMMMLAFTPLSVGGSWPPAKVGELPTLHYVSWRVQSSCESVDIHVNFMLLPSIRAAVAAQRAIVIAR